MTDRHKKWLKYILYGIGIYLLYVAIVYTYFQFEQFSSSQPDITFPQALWYVILNPTGLGSAGDFMTFPSTFAGKLISIIFVLTGLGLLGAFIGKIGDLFSEYREYRRLGYAGTDFTDHYVVIGWNDFNRLVVEELVQSGRRVAIVTEDKQNIELIYNQHPQDQVFVLFAELQNESKFSSVNINEASNVLISPETDTDALVSLLNLKDLYEKPEYIVAIRDLDLAPTLRNSGASYVVARYESSAGLIASQIFEPDSAQYLNDLMTSVREGDDHEFQQYYVTEESKFAGEPYGEAFEGVYETTDCLPLALSKKTGGEDSEYQIDILPEDDVMVEAGDYLVAIVIGKQQSEMESLMGVSQGEQNGGLEID